MKELNHPDPKRSAAPNPIEEAIGDRAKDPKAQEKFTKEYQTEPIPQNPSEIPDEPSPSEMQGLEELNRRTVEKLQDQYPEETLTLEEKRILESRKPIIPVSKPDPQPVTKSSSQESPPQKIEKEIFATTKQGNIVGIGTLTQSDEEPKITVNIHDNLGKPIKDIPAEDKELTALRKYILEDGFNEAAVAFHIVTLCSQPLVTTSTTTWAYQDRAKIPEMVLALLYKPGYIEGLWPSLKIIMGSNVGNAAWSSGVAMTIAFFDIIRMLPVLEEIKRCSETELK